MFSLLLALSALESIVAIAAGFLAGLINTVAGNGSAITLPVLVALLVCLIPTTIDALARQ